MKQFFHLFLAALIGGVAAAALVVGLNDGRPALASQASIAPAAAPLLVAQGSPAEELPAPLDLRPAARLAIPAVVHIKAFTKDRQREAVKALFSEKPPSRKPREGEGSGVIYTSGGYIVTNHHVVANATDITVTTTDRKTYPASLVGEDPKSDLAVLRIDGKDLPYLKLADSDAVEPGAWVLAVGNPFGLTSTVTAGIVSARGRSINLLSDLDAIESFLQTDAAVNPGNSGGALVTADGKLAGINTAIASQTGKFQGYSFAIPSNLVQRIADDIIAYGSYRRAFLGVEISTFTNSDQQRLGLNNRTEGVVIDAIFAGGSAAAAGLKVDDLIVRVGKRTIRDLPELTELIGRARVGETLKLTVVRNGSEVEVVVPLID
ncbi:PDZ domain-containing protein [Neolewinella aurantiaca]|uniref:PDZ domain-containing protein n=1 Tax=Neolewinella aurantiaca TaxID=2602767 RepID=A0A5C7FUD5_9BACT|nr:trypsin-like peptidase domain-containing protein [Neolewinella aurantiaca]TXF89934.1 PDZ domain-containing protein [Neolewinella aurantiaca]